ncbi:winged helix-turn-helix domain-containing protein [Shinella zoogloeoides]|uniref:winged helix-turn-helix domain-containing protein n=1 Tax=Shinella zoogloeoides TaxID=352475 RepID=UPI0028A7BDD4|nr:winged helix-turn-helix domain-containing protein [Shinella zoogloeoides]
MSATDDGGVWVSVADLAKRKGVTRQSASERIAKLERDGLIVTRREGRSKLVELATYDRVVGQVGDVFREQAAETKQAATREPQASGPLRDAQAERAQYEAKLKALDFAERTGQVVAVRGPHGVETAMIRIVEQIVRELQQPFDWIPDLIEASSKGEPAMRRVLRKKIHEQRQAISAKMTAILGEALDAEAAGVEVDLASGDE